MFVLIQPALRIGEANYRALIAVAIGSTDAYEDIWFDPRLLACVFAARVAEMKIRRTLMLGNSFFFELLSLFVLHFTGWVVTAAEEILADSWPRKRPLCYFVCERWPFWQALACPTVCT